MRYISTYYYIPNDVSCVILLTIWLVNKKTAHHFWQVVIFSPLTPLKIEALFALIFTPAIVIKALKDVNGINYAENFSVEYAYCDRADCCYSEMEQHL